MSKFNDSRPIVKARLSRPSPYQQSVVKGGDATQRVV